MPYCRFLDQQIDAGADSLARSEPEMRPLCDDDARLRRGVGG